jgi:hypothetical protein
VYDLGEHAGQQFLVMELLDGVTLKQLVDGRPLEQDNVADMTAQATGLTSSTRRATPGARASRPSHVRRTESRTSASAR